MESARIEKNKNGSRILIVPYSQSANDYDERIAEAEKRFGLENARIAVIARPNIPKKL